MNFKLHSEFAPTGDQPTAIEKLSEGLQNGEKYQTLLGVTGSGKTFTIANVVEKVQKPTLVLAHNKTFQSKAQEAIEQSLKGVTWKPGTLNGKPVASQFKMPITMNFE